MKCLLALFIVWIIRKFLLKNALTKLDVLFYMLLGIIGVFVWPIIFEKMKLIRCMRILKKMVESH